MTERVDLDRLADFVGGALDGTPSAAEVRRLVDTDPDWAAAHDDLAEAMSSVSDELRTIGAVIDPVPEAVVARLDAALHNLGSSTGAASVSRPAEAAPGGPGAVLDGPAAGAATPGPAGALAGRTADVTRPGTARGPGGTGPGRERKRRTARWAAGLSAAAAVIAFGIGIVATFPTRSDNAESTAGADAAAPAMAPTTTAGGTVISGRDYRADSFTDLTEPAPAMGVPFASESRANRDAPGAKANQAIPPGIVPPELARFQSADAIDACLDAIRQVYGGSVQIVDLARYEGKPAVVVLLNGVAAGGGRPLVVVAGPGCGETPGTTDEVFHGPLA
jgi:hypothetical protein